MDREGKGKSVGRHLDDYSILDLETTGMFFDPSCIVEISALKVRNNCVVDEFSTLVNPLCHIPSNITAINHITDDMVKGAPVINDVIDDFIGFVGDDVILGYNNASFDINIIYDSLLSLRGTIFSNDYIDLLHVAKRCHLDLENYKLETLCRYYSLDTTGEHRALKDCYLTKDCYDIIFNDFGDVVFKPSSSGSHRGYRFSNETIALRELQAFLETITSDGEITLVEISELNNWMGDHRDLSGNYPFDRVYDALDDVLNDGRISTEELKELQVLFSDYLDPVKSESCEGFDCSICDKQIVLTGDFDYGTREAVSKLIESFGGIIKNSVTKKTDYIVVGAKGSEFWKTNNYGGKIQKALELKAAGNPIEIIEESVFMQSILNPHEETSEVVQSDTISNNNWVDNICQMLSSLVVEYNLPTGSLYLVENRGKNEETKNNVNSYSVCIWEPSYPFVPGEKPKNNKLVANIVPSTIKSRPNDLDINIKLEQEQNTHPFLPSDAVVLEQTKMDLSSGSIKIRFDQNSPNLTEYIKQNAIYCIENYESKSSRFGCCSLFNKCSDAKKCLHSNLLYSKACMYRSNLEKGNVFYGNKAIKEI